MLTQLITSIYLSLTVFYIDCTKAVLFAFPTIIFHHQIQHQYDYVNHGHLYSWEYRAVFISWTIRWAHHGPCGAVVGNNGGFLPHIWGSCIWGPYLMTVVGNSGGRWHFMPHIPGLLGFIWECSVYALRLLRCNTEDHKAVETEEDSGSIHAWRVHTRSTSAHHVLTGNTCACWFWNGETHLNPGIQGWFWEGHTLRLPMCIIEDQGAAKKPEAEKGTGSSFGCRVPTGSTCACWFPIKWET